MSNQTNELLASHEPYFAPVQLTSSDIFCGDEREPVDAAEPYIHIFGGALFVPYTLTVLQELQAPGSGNFEAATHHITQELVQRGIHGLGVHSDTHAEHGRVFQFKNTTGKVGCGYAGLRAPISQLIYEHADEILAEIDHQKPALLANSANHKFARDVTGAHGRLAPRVADPDSGRRVVLAAIGSGAKAMLVDGDHAAHDGLINYQAGSSLQTGRALQAGLPAYDHDMWASQALFKQLRGQHGFSSEQLEIASLIDVIGTMKALNVGTIATRD